MLILYSGAVEPLHLKVAIKQTSVLVHVQLQSCCSFSIFEKSVWIVTDTRRVTPSLIQKPYDFAVCITSTW